MSDINSVIQNSLKEINFEEIVKEAAVSKIRECVKRHVEDQFSGYSKFGENLKEHIKNELSIDFSRIQLQEYREFVINQVNKSLASFVNEDQAKEIQKYINSKVVGESRDEIEFSVFWDELCAMIKESCDDEDEEKYVVEFGQSRDSFSSRNYHDLKISVIKDTYSYRSNDGKSEVIYAAFSDGKIYHMRNNDDCELSHVFTWLKALHFRKTKILNPDQEVSAKIPNHDY